MEYFSRVGKQAWKEGWLTGFNEGVRFELLTQIATMLNIRFEAESVFLMDQIRHIQDSQRLRKIAKLVFRCTEFNVIAKFVAE